MIYTSMGKKVLITGGTGFIGANLTKKLVQKDYTVIHLSRNRKRDTSIPTYLWNIEKGTLDKTAIENTEAIIHLAGAGIAEKRWSEERKSVLYDSRIKSTELIHKVVQNTDCPVNTFICASATGIYGYDTGDALCSEESAPGNDFLASLTKDWEASAEKMNRIGVRTIKLRTGIVLGKKDGMVKKLLPTAKLGLGAAFGSGKQYLSWIHIDDLTNLYVEALENKTYSGTYNAVAPNPVRNKEFMQIMAKVLRRPYILPNIPDFVLKIALGELSSALLGGNKVSSKKIETLGYAFNYKNLYEALTQLINNS